MYRIEIHVSDLLVKISESSGEEEDTYSTGHGPFIDTSTVNNCKSIPHVQKWLELILQWITGFPEELVVPLESWTVHSRAATRNVTSTYYDRKEISE